VSEQVRTPGGPAFDADAHLDELAEFTRGETAGGERAQKWGDVIVCPAGAIGSPGRFMNAVYVQSRFPQLWWVHVAAQHVDPAAVGGLIDVQVGQGASHGIAEQIFGPFPLTTQGEFWTPFQLGIFFPASQLHVSVRVNVNSPPVDIRVLVTTAAIERAPGGVRL
jgi:hypothetical protein